MRTISTTILTASLALLPTACLFEKPDSTDTSAAAYVHGWSLTADTTKAIHTAGAYSNDTLFLRPGDTLWLRASFQGQADQAERIDDVSWLPGSEDLQGELDEWTAWELPDSGTVTISLQATDAAGSSETPSTGRTVRIIPDRLPAHPDAIDPMDAEATGDLVTFRWDSTDMDPTYHRVILQIAADSAFLALQWSKDTIAVGRWQKRFEFEAGLHWWRVCVTDRIDIACGEPGQFYYQGLNLENGGEVHGSVDMDGLPVGAIDGVIATLSLSNSSTVLRQVVSASGTFQFSSLQPGEYTVHVEDTLVRGFLAPEDTVIDVPNLRPIHLPTLAFTDTSAPLSYATGLAAGDTLYALADARTLVLQGGFTDLGGGVDPATASFVLDGQVITASATVATRSWSFASPAVRDGAHTLIVVAEDYSGQPLQSSWNFTVNAKKLGIQFLSGPTVAAGDTIRAIVSTSNLTPALQQLRWDTDGGSWDDFTTATSDTVVITSTVPWAGHLKVSALDVGGTARDSSLAFEFTGN